MVAWAAYGDTTIDGVVDVLDAADMLGTGLYDAGWCALAAGASVVAVPEPATVVFMALAAAGGRAATARRRRGSR